MIIGQIIGSIRVGKRTLESCDKRREPFSRDIDGLLKINILHLRSMGPLEMLSGTRLFELGVRTSPRWSAAASCPCLQLIRSRAGEEEKRENEGKDKNMVL